MLYIEGGLDSHEAGANNGGKNINNLTYEDDPILPAENSNDLK